MYIDTSHKVCEVIQRHINREIEEIWVLALNSNLQLIEKRLMFRGTLNQCLFHPRDIFRYVSVLNAACFIMVHNHPSGDFRPSKSDRILTKRLYALSIMMEIPLKDHVIVTDHGHYSFAENAKLKIAKSIKTNMLAGI